MTNNISTNTYTYTGTYTGHSYCKRCGDVVSPNRILCDVCRQVSNIPVAGTLPIKISYTTDFCQDCVSGSGQCPKYTSKEGKEIIWGGKIGETITEHWKKIREKLKKK